MGETWGFIGGYLSWVPVILNGASAPRWCCSCCCWPSTRTRFDALGHPAAGHPVDARSAWRWRNSPPTRRIMNVALSSTAPSPPCIFICGVLFATQARFGHARSTSNELFTLNFACYGLILRPGAALPSRRGDPLQHGGGVPVGTQQRHEDDLLGFDGPGGHLPLTTLGTMMALPGINRPRHRRHWCARVSGHSPGPDGNRAVALAVNHRGHAVTYQVAYSRLIFVSGLERHLPRIFTHLNPRTRNPVTAILVQGSLSSLHHMVVLFSQSSMTNVMIYMKGALQRRSGLLSGFFFLIPVIIARYKYTRSLRERGLLADSRRHPRRLDLSSSAPSAPSAASTTRSSALARHTAVHLDDVGRRPRPRHVRRSVLVFFFGRRSAASPARQIPWPISRSSTSSSKSDAGGRRTEHRPPLMTDRLITARTALLALAMRGTPTADSHRHPIRWTR